MLIPYLKTLNFRRYSFKRYSRNTYGRYFLDDIRATEIDIFNATVF